MYRAYNVKGTYERWLQVQNVLNIHYQINPVLKVWGRRPGNNFQGWTASSHFTSWAQHTLMPIDSQEN